MILAPELNPATTLLTSFLGSLVECVEALTIVLAVGSARGWRHALLGAAAALVALGFIVTVVGRPLASLPFAVVHIGIGGLTLLFGLRWLRKAILRSAGVVPIHDETVAYRATIGRFRNSTANGRRPIDRAAFVASFQIVLMEGIEVVFIVIAVAANGGYWWPAITGACAAMGVVVALGAALHRPLARIPENTLKFLVGVALSGLGTLWVGEGIGLHWPGGDLAVPILIACYWMLAVALVAVARRQSVSVRNARPRAPIDESRADREPIDAPSHARGAAKIPEAPAVTAPRVVANRSSVTAGCVARAMGAISSLFVDDRALASGTIVWIVLFRVVAMQWPSPDSFRCAAITSGLVALLAYSTVRTVAHARTANSTERRRL